MNFIFFYFRSLKEDVRISERSIGILHDSEDGDREYKPLTNFNWEFISHISGPYHDYRGWEINLKINGGRDFKVHISKEKLKSFPLFLAELENQTWGEVLESIPFEASLWTDLVVKRKNYSRWEFLIIL